MKKLFVLFVTSVAMALACQKAPENVPVTSVSLNQQTAEMEVGETVQLKATVLPAEATDKSVTWSSSNKSVAMVENGTVVAIAEGSTTITASSGGKSATCAVTVKKKTVDVTSVELNKTELALVEGDSETLTATVKPDDATDKTVTWSSSDSSIAKVDDGKVTAVKEGTATITAKAGEKSATCKVVVAKKVIEVESVELDKTTLELVEGDSETLIATVKPGSASDKTVTWFTSDASIAIVENGKVTAVKEGEATITAKAGEKSATCKVVVTRKVIIVESVELNKTSIELVEGDSETLTATVKPDNATDKTVTWSTSDASIAHVENGAVTAKKEGEAIITARAGDKEANCSITVKHNAANDAIVFADENLKEKLVAAFDTNGDGELSYSEAAAVHSTYDLKIAFGTTHTFRSFDEFQYFTGIDEIYESTFSSWTLLTSIILPETINKIKDRAFENCTSLPAISFPGGLLSIGKYAFSGCTRLVSVSLPEGLSTLGYRAFYDCASLVSVKFPSSLYSISDSAFNRCTSLASITLPEGVSHIGELAFSGCASLSSVSLPSSLRSINQYAFSSCVSMQHIYLGSLSVLAAFGTAGSPSCSSEKAVHLYVSGFEVTTLALPEEMTTISYGFLRNCVNITSVIIPDGVSSIGQEAFYGCEKLQSVEIPNAVNSIGAGAFTNCKSLSSAKLPEGLTSISKSIFECCESLRSIEIPAAVKSIGNSAFSGCTSLASISFPEGLTDIGSKAFYECTSLTSLTVPNGVSSIGYYTFSGCTSLAAIKLPDGLSSIDSDAFSDCTSLTSVTLPEELSTIGAYAFLRCTSLTSIVLPESLSSIGHDAFNRCNKLSSITLNARQVPKGGIYMFDNTGNCPIYVPAESVNAYKSAQYWSDYSTRIQAIN